MPAHATLRWMGGGSPAPRIIPLPPFLCHPAFPSDLTSAPTRSAVDQRVVLNGKGMGAKEWSEASRLQWSFLRPCRLPSNHDGFRDARSRHVEVDGWLKLSSEDHSFAPIPLPSCLLSARRQDHLRPGRADWVARHRSLRMTSDDC